MTDDNREGKETSDDIAERIHERMRELNREWGGQAVGVDEVFSNTVFWGSILLNMYPTLAPYAEALMHQVKVTGQFVGQGADDKLKWN